MPEENVPSVTPPATPAPGATPPATDQALEQPKYTDKQLNDLIAKEAGKRQEKATADLLAKMGFKSIEEVEAFNKSRQESMTQAEKDKLKLAEQEAAAATNAKERDEARAEVAALKAGVPADKVAKVVKLAAGYDGDTMEAKITALLADFPDFVKGATGQAPRNAGLVTGQQGVSDEERLLAIARKQAGLTK
jgi:hypothetical protein